MDPQHRFTDEYQALRYSEEYMAMLAKVYSAPNEAWFLVTLLRRIIQGCLCGLLNVSAAAKAKIR